MLKAPHKVLNLFSDQIGKNGLSNFQKHHCKFVETSGSDLYLNKIIFYLHLSKFISALYRSLRSPCSCFRLPVTFKELPSVGRY